jgi:BlaI family penicillinase repressor
MTSLPRPTPGELEILRVLWDRGPSTVREVQDALGPDKAAGYTTVLKLLQIMFEKGLVRRDESTRPHVFRAAVAEARVKRRLVSDLLDQVFDGSSMSLVMQALSTKRATAGELRQLRELLAANVMTGHTSLTQPRDLAVEANAPGPPSLPGTGTDVPGKNGKGGVSADALETPLTARPGSGRGWSSLAQPILEAAMPWLVLGWAAGVMLFSIRSEWLTRPRAA